MEEELLESIIRDIRKVLRDKLFGATGPGGDCFYKDRRAAARALRVQGFKVGRSKFYEDCKQGLCQLEPGGTVSELSLRRYISRAGLKRLG